MVGPFGLLISSRLPEIGRMETEFNHKDNQSINYSYLLNFQ